jgi:hypothetical protein
MRVSLFAQADPLLRSARRQSRVDSEQQAIAAELAGFRALWLADQWQRVPLRLPAALDRVRQLSVVTNAVDLGVVLRLPPASLWTALVAELRHLNDLTGGRLRVSLDLRDAEVSADSVALGALLRRIGEALTGPQLAGLPQRLSLLADPHSAQVAGARGLGLLLAPGDELHTRRLALAHYHEARAGRPGWVARLLGVAVGANAVDVDDLRQELPAAVPLLSPAAEATLIGTAAEVTAQLTVLEIADGLDEVICAPAPGAADGDWPRATCDQLSQAVLPQLQPPARPLPESISDDRQAPAVAGSAEPRGGRQRGSVRAVPWRGPRW